MPLRFEQEPRSIYNMLKMNRCLRRLVGSRGVFRSFEPKYYTGCLRNNNTTMTIPRFSHAFFGTSPFGSRTPHSGFELTKNQLEEEKRGHDHDVEMLASEEEEDEEEELKIIEEGDMVNLSEILFTKDRDYLIRYDDPKVVTADQLAGKVVVIYFVDPFHKYSGDTCMTSLIDVYNDLEHKNCFEVVLVYVSDIYTKLDDELSLQRESENFECVFSWMPWTAIPFSDRTSRKYLLGRFSRYTEEYPDYHIMVAIDPTGMVLQNNIKHVINRYGSPAYPFSAGRVAFLDSEDDLAIQQPSLKTLLVSPQRDYVISNTGEKVPIHTLEDKVVALYFYEDYAECSNQTKELMMVYEEHENFEVVLIYLTDTQDTYMCTDEETFEKTFKTMPWLALPFKDPSHKKLKRVFDYPPGLHPDRHNKKICPTLVILGPRGEFINPRGAEFLSVFGVSGYPFTSASIAKSEAKKVMELKLEMLCSPATVFTRKDGSQVQFSHLGGKRVIFYFESEYWEHYMGLASLEGVKFWKILKEVEFLNLLKERYLQMKGTDDEFEVIYVPYNNDASCFKELVADVPWFVSHVSKLLPGGSAFLTYLGQFYNEYGWPFLLAFGRDGRLVRRTVCPKFEDTDFPFYAGSLEDEAYYKVNCHFISDQSKFSTRTSRALEHI